MGKISPMHLCGKDLWHLITIIDLQNRYISHWKVSNTMDVNWCVRVLEEAIEMHGKPRNHKYRARKPWTTYL
ncbi:hypothetical protein ACFFU9_11125 [Mariniflexile ostreae]|uniref:Transposase n=1 Tax=Mariniflexile ostreae TaxID=1520892 RepID=A0ABV5FD45_9FLAO